MKILFLILVMLVFLGSPLWTFALVSLLPRRLLGFAFVAVGIQAVVACAVWWFFWGGGIGSEAHLSESWQWAFVFAFAPVAVTAFRFFRHQPSEI
jgi:hypothetical protein